MTDVKSIDSMEALIVADGCATWDELLAIPLPTRETLFPEYYNYIIKGKLDRESWVGARESQILIVVGSSEWELRNYQLATVNTLSSKQRVLFLTADSNPDYGNRWVIDAADASNRPYSIVRNSPEMVVSDAPATLINREAWHLHYCTWMIGVMVSEEELQHHPRRLLRTVISQLVSAGYSTAAFDGVAGSMAILGKTEHSFYEYQLIAVEEAEDN